MRDAVELMKVAFRELSAGRADSPLRTPIDVEDAGGTTLFMPAYVPAEGALGVKVVSVFTNNRAHGLPTIHAVVCLVNAATGVPAAIMEGGSVTALRTGAVSGAATDLLARRDARTVAVIGAGVQGVTQAVAVATVRPIVRIIAIDVNEDQLVRYKEAMQRDWPEFAGIVETTTDSAAVQQADVICTATTSRTPVFRDADVRPGTHINGVGAYTPEMQELPPETVARATIVVDSTAAVLAEAGDLIIPLNQGLIERGHVSRELGMLVDGRVSGRTHDEEITLFKSVGNAVQDVVVARRAVDQATARGIGTTVDLG